MSKQTKIGFTFAFVLASISFAIGYLRYISTAEIGVLACGLFSCFVVLALWVLSAIRYAREQCS